MPIDRSKMVRDKSQLTTSVKKDSSMSKAKIIEDDLFNKYDLEYEPKVSWMQLGAPPAFKNTLNFEWGGKAFSIPIPKKDWDKLKNLGMSSEG